MKPEWVLVLIAALGILGQLWVGARREGKRDQRIYDLGERTERLEDADRGQQVVNAQLGGRISNIEGRCEALSNTMHLAR